MNQDFKNDMAIFIEMLVFPFVILALLLYITIIAIVNFIRDIRFRS
jgi:hypothetical protein